MADIFGGKPSAPSPLPLPAPLPAPPARSDAQTQALADAQRKKFAAPPGSDATTFLTSGGVTNPNSAVRFLGGAAKT